MEIMNEVARLFRRLQRELPGLGGLAFLGSRTIGQERPDSDLDTMFFYDFSTCRSPEEEQGTPIMTKRQQETALYERIAADLFPLFERYGIKKSGFNLVDISPENIETELEELISDIEARINERSPDGQKQGTEEITDGRGWKGMELSWLFLLGIGEGLYAARKRVLDRLEGRPHGELFFRVIMQRLKTLSSKANAYPSFQGFPASIAAARRYFLAKERASL